METSDMFYKPSGKFNIFGVILMVICMPVITIGAAYLYGNIIYYNPIIYISFFLTIIYGGFGGFALVFFAKIGKIRNGKIMFIFSLIIAALAVYASWVFWMHNIYKQYWIIMPGELWNEISNIAQVGMWSVFGITPTGFFLYLIWFIEAAIIFITTLTIGSTAAKMNPFCENCNKWLKSNDKIEFLEIIENESEFVKNVEDGNYDLIKSLNKIDDNSLEYSSIKFYTCSSCNEQHYFDLSKVKVSIDKKGKQDKNSDDIIQLMKIPQKDYEILMNK